MPAAAAAALHPPASAWTATHTRQTAPQAWGVSAALAMPCSHPSPCLRCRRRGACPTALAWRAAAGPQPPSSPGCVSLRCLLSFLTPAATTSCWAANARWDHVGSKTCPGALAIVCALATLRSGRRKSGRRGRRCRCRWHFQCCSFIAGAFHSQSLGVIVRTRDLAVVPRLCFFSTRSVAVLYSRIAGMYCSRHPTTNTARHLK